MCDWREKVIDTIKVLHQVNENKRYFSLDKDIVPKFKQSYPLISENIEKTKKEISKILISDTDTFQSSNNKTSFCLNKNPKQQDSPQPKKKIEKKSTTNKKKPQSLWCHQCKQKHNDILYCSKFYSGSCTKKYCKGCIERHYNECFSTIQKDKWICLFCRNLCVCAFCRRKRGEDVPKKVFKRKKSDTKESSPSSPQKRSKKTRSNQKENPKNISECSNPKKEKKIVIKKSPSPSRSPAPSTPVTPVKIENDNEIKNSTPVKIENEKIVEKTIEEPNMEPKENISIAQLMKQKLINIGDKLVFVQNSIFTGEILEYGNIKLEWCNFIVPNIEAFTQVCGVDFTWECLDNFYCNGKTLKYFISSYNTMIKEDNNIDDNNIVFDFMNCDEIDNNEFNIIEKENNSRTAFNFGFRTEFNNFGFRADFNLLNDVSKENVFDDVFMFDIENQVMNSYDTFN